MRDVSSEMPPPGALTWPSSEVPTPNGDDRHAMLGAGPHDLLHLFRRFGRRRRRPAPASGYRWWCARAGRGSPAPVCRRSPKRCFRMPSAAAMPASLRSTAVDGRQSHAFLRGWTSVADAFAVRLLHRQSARSTAFVQSQALRQQPRRSCPCPLPPPSSLASWRSRRTGSTITAISTWPITTCCSTAARTTPSRLMGLGPDYAQGAQAHHLHGRSPRLLRAGAASRRPGHGELPAARPRRRSGCAPTRRSATSTAGSRRPRESLSLHVDMTRPEGGALPRRHLARRSRRCAPPMPACRCPNGPAARSGSSASPVEPHRQAIASSPATAKRASTGEDWMMAVLVIA